MSTQSDSDVTTLKWTAEVTFGYRRAYRQMIEGACFKYDLNCEAYEEKGFLRSDMHFKVSGPPDKIRVFQISLKDWHEREEAAFSPE